jgi:hypothetical protein
MKTDRKIIQQRYREKNREILREKNRLYKEQNKEIIKEKNKVYKKENKDKITEYNLNTKEQRKLTSKLYREKNADLIKQKKREYYEANKDKIIEYNRNYKINRMKNDPLYLLKRKISNVIYKAVKHNFTKNKSTLEILGCSYEEFKLHLESQFEPWMTWDNYGLYKPNTLNYGWDIDHIIPNSSAKTEQEVIQLNHYSNLKPLCSHTNRYIKKDNLI